MNIESLGILETNCISGYLKVADLFSKIIEIKLLGNNFLGGGNVVVFIQGTLGAIQNALIDAEKILTDSNCFVVSHSIPMPHKDLLLKFKIGARSWKIL